jgi:hypothetical protein
MQTHNLKLHKKYRDVTSDFYMKAGIVLIAILVILNVVLLTLFLKERNNNKTTMQALQETNKSLILIQESLGKTDIQKAFVHMAEARRQVAIALPAAPVAAPEQAAPESGTPKVKQPAGEQMTTAAPAKTDELKIAVDDGG